MQDGEQSAGDYQSQIEPEGGISVRMNVNLVVFRRPTVCTLSLLSSPMDPIVIAARDRTKTESGYNEWSSAQRDTASWIALVRE